MSVEYYFVCHECKQSIHVAQDGFSGWSFYSGEADCMRALGPWLESHKFHPSKVTLAPEQHYEDYKELVWNDPRPPPTGSPMIEQKEKHQ